MKIDEPKTPFVRYDPEMEKDLDLGDHDKFAQLRSQHYKMKEALVLGRSFDDEDEDEDEDDGDNEKEKEKGEMTSERKRAEESTNASSGSSGSTLSSTSTSTDTTMRQGISPQSRPTGPDTSDDGLDLEL
ncbi:hypothetical protein BGW38_003770 [Lunasporangiospora selenospora]|uniref:Uncharacterized protein n=1 Tax=Lunasporangiospora selenospora TaxID=979761 RepID=A0A9P6KBZ3_9FUNG|nr:hypothetical protein BGW38_003770 [Lunasporangiospora selenospora]